MVPSRHRGPPALTADPAASPGSTSDAAGAPGCRRNAPARPGAVTGATSFVDDGLNIDPRGTHLCVAVGTRSRSARAVRLRVRIETPSVRREVTIRNMALVQSGAMTATTARSRGRWIDDWDPDDETFWSTQGAAIARKNLILSMFVEHIGFCVWVLWTIVVLNLDNIGIAMSVSELFLLTLIPNLVGSALRIPYTSSPFPAWGRAWTTVSGAPLFVPTILLAAVVPSGWLLEQSHTTQLCVLVLCVATAGVGGGNFSSSMANISFFHPERKKGWALGLNAAGGNMGVAVARAARAT